VSNESNNIKDLQEDIEKKLLSFPLNCPPELQGIRHRGGMNISGHELTSTSFLELWKSLDEMKGKRKKNPSDAAAIKSGLIQTNGRRKSKRGSATNNSVLSQIKNLPEEELIRFNDELENILEENIEQDVIIKTIQEDESDSDEDEISDSREVAHNNPISEISNKINIKNIYIKNILSSSYKSMIPKFKSISSRSKLWSDLKELNYSIHDVKGDGVCNNYLLHIMLNRTVYLEGLRTYFSEMKINTKLSDQ
jgi:hypothetical protein